MLRLLNFSFNGDIHCFFITNIKVGNRIHRFCLHKGHDLAYDVKTVFFCVHMMMCGTRCVSSHGVLLFSTGKHSFTF